MKKTIYHSDKLHYFFVALIVFVGAYLRFYKLNWGEGMFFHPDEYHIVMAVKRIVFPTHLNPELFSYGSVNVYLLYMAKQLIGLWEVPSSINLFILGRAISATYATATILLTYFISRELFDKFFVQTIPPTLVALTPGLIQQAHFATPESTLTFWLTLTLLLWLLSLKKSSGKYLFISAITLGIAIGSKVVALTFLPFLLITSLLLSYKFRIRTLFNKISTMTSLLLTTAITTTIVFPYSILDYSNYIRTMKYETGVGRGSPLVFYTRQFIDTTPVVFQFTKILPYALGQSLLWIGSIGFVYSIYYLLNKKNVIVRRKKWFVVSGVFLVYFVSNAILFAKWTRFIAPSFLFWSLFSALILDSIYKRKQLFIVVVVTLITTTTIWVYMFFSIYKNQDIRVRANEWVQTQIPKGSRILTESGNMFEVPFTGDYSKLSFDYYKLDNNEASQRKLALELEKSDYFIIQSRRVYQNHIRQPDLYATTSNFYTHLFDGSLGFREVKRFSSFPKLNIFGATFEINDELAEETWSVFDHPVLIVYEKQNVYSQKYYSEILGTSY